MGTTIITKRLTATIRRRDDHIWILFKKTYESNVYPHAPDWNIYAIGRIDGALKSIFRSAGACQGGLLRAQSGNISSESHIHRWIAALRHSVVMTDREIRLTKVHMLEALSLLGRQGVEDAWGELASCLERLGSGPTCGVALDIGSRGSHSL